MAVTEPAVDYQPTDLTTLLREIMDRALTSYVVKNRKSVAVVDSPLEDQIRWCVDRLKERLP